MKSIFVFMTVLAVACITMTAMPKPKVFVMNDGRWPAHVLAGANSQNAIVWITTKGMVIDQRLKNSDGIVVSKKVDLNVLGSSGSRDIQVTRTSSTASVTILTKGAPQSPLQTADNVVVRNVLPGVNIEYTFDGENVRYNVHARAGVSVPQPLFEVNGATGTKATKDGILCTTELGSVSMNGIVSFQGSASNTKKTTWSADQGQFGFEVKSRVMNQPLTIDPVVYVKGLHGSADEAIYSIQIAKNGNVVVGGWTTSFDFVIPDGGYNTTGGAGEDGFVAILSKDLSTVIQWTYVAGAKNERVRDIALNSKGEVWAVGETNSTDFPVGGSPVGQTFGGVTDGFAILFSEDLKTMIGGMYLAGNKEDRATAVGVNSIDQAIVVGTTRSESGLSSVQGHDNSFNGGTDGFIFQIHPKLNNIAYFTYYGGPGDDEFTNLFIDENSAMLICGFTKSAEFAIWPVKTITFFPGDGYYTYDRWEESGVYCFDHVFNGGESDAIVTKFSANGQLVFASYYGGSGADVATDVFNDANGSIYIVGNTKSNNLPVPDGSPSAYGGGYDGFMATCSPDGLKLRGTRYVGGSSDDMIFAGSISDANTAILTGSTTSADFPIAGVSANDQMGGMQDAYITKLTFDEIKQSSFVGWANSDVAYAVAKDALGDIFIGGRTESDIAPGSVKGVADAFIVKWANGVLTYTGPTPSESICRGKQTAVKWTTSDLPSTESFAVDLSTDNGTTWTEIGTNIKSKIFNYTILESTPEDAKCLFRVRTVHGHTAATASALNLLNPPVITVAPEPVTACPNSAVKLMVQNSGTDVKYQWRKDGTAITGATSTELSIAAATSNDAGEYDVVLTNSCSVVTSARVTLEIADKPAIVTQPTGASLPEGGTLELMVGARGQDLTYQWKKDGSDVQGASAKTATLTIVGVTSADAGKYTCVISSACGSSTSDEVSVVISGTSVDETDNVEDLIVLSPLPANDVVRVTSIGVTERGVLIVKNSIGAEVARINVMPSANGVELSLNTNQLPAGSYTVQLVAGSVLRSAIMVVTH